MVPARSAPGTLTTNSPVRRMLRAVQWARLQPSASKAGSNGIIDNQLLGATLELPSSLVVVTSVIWPSSGEGRHVRLSGENLIFSGTGLTVLSAPQRRPVTCGGWAAVDYDHRSR